MRGLVLALLSSLLISPLSVVAQEAALHKSYELEALGKYGEASAALAMDDNAATGPNSSFMLARRGWLAYMQGLFNESVSLYKRSLERNPKSIEARVGITLPLLAQQRWRETALYARQIIAESAWDYTAHVRLMVAEEGMKDWKGLQEHAQKFTERYPSDTSAWVYLARAHAWQGNTKEARLAYQRVLERFPKHIEATRYLAVPTQVPAQLAPAQAASPAAPPSAQPAPPPASPPPASPPPG